MFQSILEDVKREFNYGNMVTRIIILNVAVFIIVIFANLIMQVISANGGNAVNFVRLFALNSDWKYVLLRPWSIVTHMFLHQGLWHILWNMLFLYWFGRIVGDFIGNQRVLPIYLLGGLSGAAVYLFIANIIPIFVEQVPPIFNMGDYALGASAGVMAIVVAAGVISPDYIMRLLFFGDVRLKYIVGVLVLLDLLALTRLENTGGSFAHLGGAAMGLIFVRQLRNGVDWAFPINNILHKIGSIFKKGGLQRAPKGPKVVYKNPSKKARASVHKAGPVTDEEDLSYQEQLDAILDKIKQNGYDSLTEEEKKFLFNASKK
ncbi:MAG: rhomboid family intramembrane serine protease [Saprospiraceae bacterium]|nr:rhomboid family intramembrane serine protease [Saprospiraceae bacterium]